MCMCVYVYAQIYVDSRKIKNVGLMLFYKQKLEKINATLNSILPCELHERCRLHIQVSIVFTCDKVASK